MVQDGLGFLVRSRNEHNDPDFLEPVPVFSLQGSQPIQLNLVMGGFAALAGKTGRTDSFALCSADRM